MARIKITELVVDEALDASALKWIWGGRDPKAVRASGLVAAGDLPGVVDRALLRPVSRSASQRPQQHP